MKTLLTIENCPVLLHDDGSLTYTAKAAIDGDGSGPSHGDPDYQDDTSLHMDGEALNSDVDIYTVLPPVLIEAVGPVCLGCQARIINTRTGHATDAVVGDIGPGRTMKTAKLGEISIAAAKAIGVNPSPTTGGEDAHVIAYTIWPGRPAQVGDKKYTLQAI